MPRGQKRKTTASVITEELIEKAQEKVIKRKMAYDAAVDELQSLLDKRDAQRKDELWNAIVKSQKSYEEILKYIISSTEADETE